MPGTDRTNAVESSSSSTNHSPTVTNNSLTFLSQLLSSAQQNDLASRMPAAMIMDPTNNQPFTTTDFGALSKNEYNRWFKPSQEVGAILIRRDEHNREFAEQFEPLRSMEPKE